MWGFSAFRTDHSRGVKSAQTSAVPGVVKNPTMRHNKANASNDTWKHATALNGIDNEQVTVSEPHRASLFGVPAVARHQAEVERSHLTWQSYALELESLDPLCCFRRCGRQPRKSGGHRAVQPGERIAGTSRDLHLGRLERGEERKATLCLVPRQVNCGQLSLYTITSLLIRPLVLAPLCLDCTHPP